MVNSCEMDISSLIPGRDRFISPILLPDQLWDPPSLLSSDTRNSISWCSPTMKMNYPPPCINEVKNVWGYFSTSPVSESESELLYDWWFTANQFVLATSPLRLTTSNFISQLNTCGYSPYVTSFLMRGLVCHLQLPASPRQRSHSQVRVTRYSRLFFTVSDSRVPQPGGRGLRIYIPQEQSGPLIPPGTEFHFCRLLRFAGLRWRYSTPPSHGSDLALRLHDFVIKYSDKLISFLFPLSHISCPKCSF
jgi:hypothetical protein